MTNSGGDAGQPPDAEPNSGPAAESSSGSAAEATEQVQLPPAYAEQPSLHQPTYPPPQGYGPPQGFDAALGYGSPPPQPYGPPPGFGGPPPQPYNAAAGYGQPPYPPQAGYVPPPGYPAPAYAGGYGPPRLPTNGLAIGSLAASCIGLFLTVILFPFGGFIGSIPALVGIVLGIVALNQIKGRGEGGRSLAIAGIAVGGAALVIGIGAYIVYFALFIGGS